jgi:hypothetical protein
MLVQYTLTLLSSQLTKLLALQLSVFASRFAAKAQATLLPNERVVATFPAPASTNALADTIARCKAASALASDVRTAMRLFGLVDMYQWARGTYLAPPKDMIVKAITWAQIVVNTGYYVIENQVYLSEKGVLRGWSAENKARWWRASSLCFGAHVVMEFVRLGRVWQLNQKEAEVLGEGKDDKQEVMEKRRKEQAEWKKMLQLNTAYAPLCVQWCGVGSVSDTWFGLLGTWAACLYVRDAWRNSA